MIFIPISYNELQKAPLLIAGSRGVCDLSLLTHDRRHLSTNRFHLEVRVFSDTSQATSKYGKNIGSVTRCSVTANWNLFEGGYGYFPSQQRFKQVSMFIFLGIHYCLVFVIAFFFGSLGQESEQVLQGPSLPGCRSLQWRGWEDWYLYPH